MRRSGVDADEGKTIAEGEDDAGNAVVGGDVVIEGTYATGLRITLIVRVNDVTVPQGVVGEDVSAWRHHGEYRFVGVDVCALVAIDECHVERDAFTLGK